MKRLILVTNGFPGPSEEPFLRTEYPYLKEEFDEIVVHRFKQETAPDTGYETINLKKVYIPVRRALSANWKLLIHAWLSELGKSGKWRYYLKHFKRYFNIWIGWLNEAAAWEKALKQFDPKETIIYTYWYENQAIPLTILRAKGKLPFKWISRAHGWDVDPGQREEKIIPFRHWMLQNKPNTLVSISQFGRDVFRNIYRSDSQVHRLGTCDFGPAQRFESSGELKICSISSLIPLKRVQAIVKLLSQSTVPIVWTHFGTGPLEREITWDSLPKGVQLVKRGHIKHEALLAELGQGGFDLMLHLSEHEGIPVSIMECMSYGIPVMACEVGGISEIVSEDNGWLLPVNLDYKHTANLIDELAVNRQALREKGIKAREKWEQDYNADVNFPKFIQSFLSIPSK